MAHDWQLGYCTVPDGTKLAVELSVLPGTGASILLRDPQKTLLLDCALGIILPRTSLGHDRVTRHHGVDNCLPATGAL